MAKFNEISSLPVENIKEKTVADGWTDRWMDNVKTVYQPLRRHPNTVCGAIMVQVDFPVYTLSKHKQNPNLKANRKK